MTLEEKIKLDFELQFKDLFKKTTENDYRILTRKGYASSQNETTLEEFKKELQNYLVLATKSNPEIKKFRPSLILDEEKFEVKIKYDY